MRQMRKEHGASLMEFAILIPLGILMLGFLIDFCLSIFNYALLHHSINTVTRKVALDVAGAVTQQTLGTEAENRAREFISESFGSNMANYQFTGDVQPDENGRCKVILTGRVLASCTFCQVFSFNIPISSTSSWVVEDACYTGGC